MIIFQIPVKITSLLPQLPCKPRRRLSVFIQSLTDKRLKNTSSGNLKLPDVPSGKTFAAQRRVSLFAAELGVKCCDGFAVTTLHPPLVVNARHSAAKQGIS